MTTLSNLGLSDLGLSILAQTTQPAATRPEDLPLLVRYGNLIPIILLVLIFYFFIARAKKTQDKKRADLLGQLKTGDRVQTIGGILGTVIKSSDSEVTLKVDETSNTKIRFSRSAIHRVVTDEPETK